MIYITSKGCKKKIAANDTATIAISLHNPNHNGDKFKYIIDWVNAQENFRHCQVDLSDSLYRHNYMMGDESLNEMQAYIRARKNGAEWLDKHTSFLEQLTMPYEVIRWDKWLDHPEFYDTATAYYAYYNSDPVFKEAVDSQVYTFFERKNMSREDVPARSLKHSADFLLEELTCHTIMYRETPAVKIYPGSLPACYKYVREYGAPNIVEPLKGMTFARLLYHGVDVQEKSKLLSNASNTNEERKAA